MRRRRQNGIFLQNFVFGISAVVGKIPFANGTIPILDIAVGTRFPAGRRRIGIMRERMTESRYHFLCIFGIFFGARSRIRSDARYGASRFNGDGRKDVRFDKIEMFFVVYANVFCLRGIITLYTHIPHVCGKLIVVSEHRKNRPVKRRLIFSVLIGKIFFANGAIIIVDIAVFRTSRCHSFRLFHRMPESGNNGCALTWERRIIAVHKVHVATVAMTIFVIAVFRTSGRDGFCERYVVSKRGDHDAFRVGIGGRIGAIVRQILFTPSTIPIFRMSVFRTSGGGLGIVDKNVPGFCDYKILFAVSDRLSVAINIILAHGTNAITFDAVRRTGRRDLRHPFSRGNVTGRSNFDTV